MPVRVERSLAGLKAIICSVLFLTLLGSLSMLADADPPPEQEWSEPAVLWSESGWLSGCGPYPCQIVPSASFNDRGMTVVLWPNGEGGRPSVLDTLSARVRTPSGGWEPLFETWIEGGAFGRTPKVDLNPDGKGFAIWQVTHCPHEQGVWWNESYDVYARPFDVSSLDTGFTQHLLASWLFDNRSLSYRWGPQVQVDSQGNAFAVWNQWDSSQERDRVYAARFDARLGWQPPGRPTAPTTTWPTTPSRTGSCCSGAWRTTPSPH